MPRGRKKVVDYDAEIKRVKDEINKLNDSLKLKKAELSTLEAKKQAEDYNDIIKAIESSGKTKEEIIKLINK